MSVHTHRCRTCDQPFACDGEETPNYDGAPAAVCSSYHVLDARQCEDCYHDDQREQYEADQARNGEREV